MPGPMAGDFPAGYRKEASRLPAEASFLPFFCNHPPPWRPLKTDNSTDIVYASLCVREAYITPCPDISGAKGEASMPPPSPRTPLPPLKGMLSMVMITRETVKAFPRYVSLSFSL